MTDAPDLEHMNSPEPTSGPHPDLADEARALAHRVAAEVTELHMDLDDETVEHTFSTGEQPL